jgi:hypothetical protein
MVGRVGNDPDTDRDPDPDGDTPILITSAGWGVVQVSGEAKELVSTTKSTKVPLFVGRLRIPRATGMPFGTRTGYGSYLPRKNTKAGTDAAENTHNS